MVEEGVPQQSDGALLAKAEKHIRELVELEEYYFGADKDQKLQTAGELAVAAIDRMSEGRTPPVRLRAKASYLKGRAESFIVGRETAAEGDLSKAIKLDPTYLEAWNALGEVYWNLQNYVQSKQCFEQCIEICGANPTSLRNLSMVLRAVGSPEEKSANFTLALAKAKEAVALDAADPQNWETLGNAYLGHFFVNGKGADEMNRALIAYDKAESAYDKLGKRNPTLYANRGSAAKFIEDYEKAAQSYRKANEIGSKGAGDEADKIVALFEKIAGVVDKRCDLKARRLRDLMADLPKDPEARNLKELRAQGSSGAAAKELPLAARVVLTLDRKGEAPVILICCDSAGEFFAVSVYNTEFDVIASVVVPMQSVLEISRPHLRTNTLSAAASRKDKDLSYPCVRVAHPADVHVRGHGSLTAAAASSVVSTKPAAAEPPAQASLDS